MTERTVSREEAMFNLKNLGERAKDWALMINVPTALSVQKQIDDFDAYLTSLERRLNDPTTMDEFRMSSEGNALRLEYESTILDLEEKVTSLESQLAEARLAARKEFAEEIIKKCLYGKTFATDTAVDELGFSWVKTTVNELRTLAAKPKEQP